MGKFIIGLILGMVAGRMLPAWWPWAERAVHWLVAELTKAAR